MLQELVIFGIVLGVSLIFKHLISKGDSIRPFYGILIRLGYIGVVIHEISHYLISLLVGIKPKEIEIKYRYKDTGPISPHGHVRVKPRSFLQTFLIAFAPLYISTWLAVFFFTIVASSNYLVIIRIIAGVFLVSTIIGAAPSSGDLRLFSYSVHFAPLYTIYQLVLLVFSILILWAVLWYFDIVLLLDVFYYLSIAAIYWGLKLSLMGISKGLSLMRTHRQKPSKVRIRRFARRRYKPQKPHKIGIEEAQW